MRFALLILLLAGPAAADERKVFYGTWGTEKQCSNKPIKPGGTVLAQPFTIGPDWLGHGAVWCRLSWLAVEPRQDGAFTGVRAQCGEDSVRGFFIRLDLSRDRLTLRWDFPVTNGPLMRCPAS